MRGARRGPYVDRVKPGNDADARPGHNPKGRGDLGAFRCREPLQYRHIAADSPPKTASHLASVAHVPVIEIGSTEYAIVPVNDSMNVKRQVVARKLSAPPRAPTRLTTHDSRFTELR